MKGNPLPGLPLAIENLILDIDQWHTPATDYPEAEIGNFRITRKKYTRGVYKYWGLDGYLMFNVKKPIPITTLQERRGKRWYDWMVDDPPQQRAMEIYAEYSKGRVLCAGLGLGLILHAFKTNRNVDQVVVIEKSQDVIQLMSPFFPWWVTENFVLDDFYHFIEVDQTDWDTIIVDLWVSHGKEEKLDIFCHKVLPMFSMLHLKYPKASVTFHGFQSVSDIKPVSDEMVKLITEIGGI